MPATGSKSLVSQVLKECCEKYRYQFSQFQVVYGLAKAGRQLSSQDAQNGVPSGNVQYQDLSRYSRAFKERTEGQEVAG